MSSSGLKTGDFSNLDVTYGLGVGTRRDNGTKGQVLTSGGTNKPMTWGSTGVSDVKADDGILVATAGSERTIKAHIDGTTIVFDNGAPTKLMKVATPFGGEALTSGTGISYNSGTTYDGSVARTISINLEDLTAGSGINYNSGTTYDGTTAKTLSIDLEDLTAGTGISYNSGTIYDGTIAKTLSINLEDLTAGTGISYDSGTTYDGATAKTLSINLEDLTAGTGLSYNSGTTYDGATAKTLAINLQNLTAGTGITFNTGTTYDGTSAITINADATPNGITNYNWWADKTTPGFRKAPTTFATGITYSNLFFNGASSGGYVSMRYTMPAGSRYFKITLDFQFVWEQPVFKGTYYPHIAYVRLVDDTTGADITLTNGAVTETTISVVNTAPLNTTAGDPVQTASISWIYDYGSTLSSNTEKVFRPQFANWFFDTTSTSGAMRDFLVLSKATTITGGSSAFQTNEFCGTIEDLGSSYVPNTNKPSPSSGA